MKLTRTSVRMNERGFTLVELMIVVAIIGILAAVAIPNFQKYQAKARQSEAKLQLSAAYTSLQSFRGEHNSYTGCLGDAGYAPEPMQRRFYAVGLQAAPPATGCGPGATPTPCTSRAWNNDGSELLACADTLGSVTSNQWAASATVYPANTAVNNSSTTNIATGATATAVRGAMAAPTGTMISTSAFAISAGGSVSSGPVVDSWFINETKLLVNNQVGL